MTKISEKDEGLLNIRLPNAMLKEVRKLPWGTKSEIYRCMTKELIKVLQSPIKDAFLGALLDGRITFTIRKEPESGDDK